VIHDESTRTDKVVAYLSTDGRRTSELTIRPDGQLYICPIGNVIDCREGWRFGRFEAPAHNATVALLVMEQAYGDDFERAV